MSSSPPPKPHAASAASLAARVRSGDDPELALLAARGLLPLPPEVLIPLQVELAGGDDRELAGQAALSLLALEPRVAASFLARRADADALAWFADKSDEPELLETILRRRDVPRSILVDLAPRLAPDLQEALVHRQDAIVEEPAIADALESNPLLTPYVRRRLGEYRQHLLPRVAPVEAPEHVADWDDDDEIGEAQLAAALEDARLHPEGGEEDPSTGLSEMQIRFLPIPVRMKLARGAPRALRAILIRDPNPLVAKEVLRGNTFADAEIERIAMNRSVDEEVLGAIGAVREWVSKYRIVVALVHNPRTPLSLSTKLVARLAVRDLRNLSRDRNVPEAVRSTAKRLYTIKRT